MKYKVSVIKKIAFLVMTMALAVAMVACSGAVGKPGEAGKDADPVKLLPLKVGTIPAMPLVVGGEAGTVALSGYFSDLQGQTLTYTAKSSMTAYATAEVDKMTLTVTAVAAGESTITVTATDTDKLMAVQTFMVTVTAATSTPTDEPTTSTPPTTLPVSVATELDIAPFLTTGQLAADYEVVSSNKSVFSSALKKGSVWTLKPTSHGMAKATIQNKKTAVEVGSVSVTVPNRAPILNSKAPTVSPVPLIAAAAGAKNDNTNDPPTKTGLGDDVLQVYLGVSVAIAIQFTDPDADDKDVLTYAFTPSRSDVKITKGKGCKTSPCVLEVDVLTKAAAVYFELEVVASDPSGEKSPALSIPVNSNKPLGQTYETQQLNDRFSPITVGYREATHTLHFGAHDNVFKFVDDHIAKLIAASDAAVAANKITSPVSDGTVMIGKPSDLKVQGATNPRHYIYVQSSGIVTHGMLLDSNAVTPVELASLSGGGDVTADPQLRFTLDGSIGMGKITLTHYIWVTPVTPDTDSGVIPRWVKSSPVSLTMTVTSVK